MLVNTRKEKLDARKESSSLRAVKNETANAVSKRIANGNS